jgi:hypothetical protein
MKSPRLNLLLTLPNSALMAVLAVLQSRWLGVEDRGLVVLILTVSGSSAVIGSLGYGLARIGDDFGKLNFKDIQLRVFVSIALALIIFIAVALFHGIELDAWIFGFLLISGLSYSCLFIFTDLLLTSHLSLRVRGIALFSILLEVFLNVLLHNSSQLTLHKVFLVNSIIAFFGLVTILYLIKDYGDFHGGEGRLNFKDLPYLVVYMSSFLYIYVYRLPASYVVNPSDLALLSISFSFAFVGTPLIYFVMHYTRTLMNDRQVIEGKLLKIVGATFLILTLLATVEFVFAKELILYTVGDDFFGSIEQLQRIAFMVPFFALFMIYLSARQGQTNTSQIKASGGYLIGNVFLILFFGATFGVAGICTSILILHLILGTFGGWRLFRMSLRHRI